MSATGPRDVDSPYACGRRMSHPSAASPAIAFAARVLRLLEPIRRGHVRDGERLEPVARRALRGIRTFRASSA